MEIMQQFDVYLVRLDPTEGAEIKKTRPCVIISPDVMNKHLQTIIVAPMTTSTDKNPVRIECSFKGKKGLVKLDHIRSVSKIRLTKKLGKIDIAASTEIKSALQEMFA